MRFREPHRLPKEVLLPDWTRRNMQVTKGGRVKSGRTDWHTKGMYDNACLGSFMKLLYEP
jgi:hypothetical protein